MGDLIHAKTSEGRYFNFVLKEKEKYEKLAEYIIHLLWDDPSLPKESLHTITYRLKDKARLIEKIDEENKQLGDEAKTIYT